MWEENCICAKPDHPGPGPQYLWNTTIKGKSYARNLKLGPELQKYMEEISHYRNFLRLCDEIIQINEKMCDLGFFQIISTLPSFALVRSSYPFWKASTFI